FSGRRRHTRFSRDWSSDVCSSDLHVIDTARALEPDAIHIVYGHGGDRVREAFPDSDLGWCYQAEQLGTGHAVAQALPEIPDGHEIGRASRREGVAAGAGGV